MARGQTRSQFGILRGMRIIASKSIAAAVVACAAAAIAADSGSLRAAVEALPDGATLTLERREYRLTPKGTRKMFLAPSNNMTGDKNVACPIVDKHNVTIDGNGATLVCDGDVFPFATLRSRGVAIRNLTVTKPRPVAAELTVVAADAQGATVRFAPGTAPYAAKDGELEFEVDGSTVSTRNGLMAMHTMDRFQVHFLLTEGSTANADDKDQYPSTYSAVAIEDLGGGELRLRYRDADRDRRLCRPVPFEPGRPLAINLHPRRNIAFFFEDAEGVRLENVAIRRFGGMGVVAQRSGDLTISGLKVLPEDGERASTSADMMQVNSCYGKVTIEGCEGSDSMDDVIDVHGNYMGVERWDGTNLVLRNYRDWGRPTGDDHYGFFPVRVGDTLSFLDGRDRREVGRLAVASLVFGTNDLSHAVVTLSGPVPLPSALPEETLVENLTLYPDVVFRGNTFRRYPNLRFSGRGRFLIESNRLENAMSAMLVHDHRRYWYETGPVEDMTIRGNVFVDCNARGGDAFITICPMGWNGGGRMGRIVLEGNRYEKLKHRRVNAFAVDDLVDRDEPWAPAEAHPDSDAYRWKPLFAADLSDAEFKEGAWRMVGGELRSVLPDPIWTKADYENYVLDFEYMMEKDGNSGVFIYISHLDQFPKYKIEVQLLDDASPKFKGMEQPYQQSGSLYGRAPALEIASHPSGEWNRMTVYCQGRKVRVVLNGKAVVNADISEWKDPLVNPDGTQVPSWHRGFPALSTIPTRGRVGFQGVHGDAGVRIRSLRIAPL